jgi:hypothetical protein
MTVKELIERLQNYVAQGYNIEAEVLTWEPESDDWQPVGAISITETEVRLFTDPQ